MALFSTDPTGPTSKGIGGAIGDIGGAVTDLFAAGGQQASAASDRISASSYRQAADIAGQNLDIEKQSVAIKQLQADREIYLNESAQKAAAAGNGFQEAGSAVAILADSANQGALQKRLIDQQGQITENATQMQINSLNTQATLADNAANAADNAAFGDTLGGALKIASSIGKLVFA